jgi:hypothetical protein
LTEFVTSVSLLLFTVLFQLLFYCLETNWLYPYVLEGVLDCTNSEGLLTKLCKVLEKGLDNVLHLIQANRIYNIRLLVSLPLLETTNVT